MPDNALMSSRGHIAATHNRAAYRDLDSCTTCQQYFAQSQGFISYAAWQEAQKAQQEAQRVNSSAGCALALVLFGFMLPIL